MGGNDVKSRPSLDYRMSSSTPMVREIPRSSPPAASPSPASPTAQTHRDMTILAAPTTTVTKKPKKRSSAKTEPPKKKGIAKPQKKKRKVIVEDEDLDDETPVRPSTKRKKNHASNTGRVQPNAHRPVPLKQQADSPPAAASLPALPLSPLPKYNAEGMELYCVCRKPDSGKWMIGCDGCEDWFHGECINVAEEDGDLIDKYFCRLSLSLSLLFLSHQTNNPPHRPPLRGFRPRYHNLETQVSAIRLPQTSTGRQAPAIKILLRRPRHHLFRATDITIAYQSPTCRDRNCGRLCSFGRRVPPARTPHAHTAHVGRELP